ncbi:MAG: tetratricopeptide repeat protein, partial [Rhodobacteraceae bacterium]|nr:tetratricopeptide repeat protein [Paracoccaceae bacterium]
HEALVRWYLSRKAFDKAESLLRAKAASAIDKIQPVGELVQFLAQYRSPEAAIAELDHAIAAGQSTAVFRSARAGFLFDRGDKKAAIAEMQDILTSESGTDDARKIKVALARMLFATGNTDEAHSLVEAVLAEDSGQMEAIRLKATWLVDGDQIADAITLLRSAIDQNPRDATLMTLLAQAYERDGNRDLVREMLVRAVDASGQAPAESLRYAQFLAANNDLLPAESVLIDALRTTPGNPDLLGPLGQLYIQLNDWPRAEAVAAALETIADPKLAPAITGLRAAILEGQQRKEDALSYLEQMAAGKNSGLADKLAVLRNHMANGRMTEAQDYAKSLLAEDPENPDIQIINAAILSASGNKAPAEQIFRKVVAKDPSRAIAWMNLYGILKADPKRQDEANALLDQALAAIPTSGELRWAKAGEQEARGEIDAAIANYEKLYAENSANPIVANNLASLLSNYRQDAYSLKRAEIIARRLRGSGIGPYQDTFGWIAWLNQHYDDALTELEAAAKALPDDPTVQYHLAMTYLKLGRAPEATAQFQRALDLAPANESRPYLAAAKAELEKLKAAAPSP